MILRGVPRPPLTANPLPTPPLARAAMSLLLLLLLLPLASARSPMHPMRPTSQVPSCRTLMAKVSDQQFIALRDAAQIHAQHSRKFVHWSLLKHYKGVENLELSKQYAYNTSLTQQELQDRMAEEDRYRNAMREKAHSLVEEMKGQGQLPQSATVEQVRVCIYGRLNTHLYEYRPKVSLMMQYFKRPWNIQPYINRIRACQASVSLELLVNVDHPQDHEAWAWAAYNTSGMVVPVFSNNVHEVRAYNRLAHIARGDYLVLVGDDDLPPTDCTWLVNVVKLLDKWTDVGVLGIRGKTACFDLDVRNEGEWFRDPVLDIPFQFVEKVDMAPLAIRKSAFMYIGGFDESLTEPGECGILTDWDICYRMWVSGWQVGATKQTRMEHDNQEGGTHKPETVEKCWGRQQGIAGQVMAARVNADLERELCNVARDLTLSQLQQLDPQKCPFPQGCKLEAAAPSSSRA